LVWFDLTGQRTGTATEPGDYWQVRLSPNGRDAAVTTLDPLLRTLDVVVVPLAAPGTAHRVSLAIGPDTDPVWSPNNTTVIYRSAQSGPGAMLARPAVQSPKPEETVLRKSTDVTPSDWRGNTLLFHTLDARGRRVIVALDRSRNLETPLTSGGFNSWDGRWSPDGRWMAYTSDESGQPDVYVQAWPTGMPRVRATFGGGQRPQWGADGTLFFRRGDAVMRASLSGTPQGPVISTPQAVLTAAGLRDFAVAPAGDRVLAIAEVVGTATPTAQLVVNWMTEVPEVKSR
jgi:dipeptidyl aminopeptidase/acylaminoacyl peptidase